ncbi:hypothetical protein C8R45DRAFT_928699 [Mycena sanguinolenta]|nr:hypothetical protein C8R45DRAFT_928699 [Mycena sanguinolenta]
MNTQSTPADGLRPTNLTAKDMIPDTFNPAHDQRFWCVPRMHDKASDGDSGAFPLYLVTQGRRVGIWHNWTVVKAMVAGWPHSAYCGHHSVEGCIQEWQLHCLLGVHPHPVDPQHAHDAPGVDSPNEIAVSQMRMTPAGLGRVVVGQLQADLQQFCRPVLAAESKADVASVTDWETLSTCSSVTTSDWAEVPAHGQYFALWKGKVVYSDRFDRRTANLAFLSAEAQGKRPRIVSTGLYDEAQAFSEGVHWIED